MRDDFSFLFFIALCCVKRKLFCKTQTKRILQKALECYSAQCVHTRNTHNGDTVKVVGLRLGNFVKNICQHHREKAFPLYHDHDDHH